MGRGCRGRPAAGGPCPPQAAQQALPVSSGAMLWVAPAVGCQELMYPTLTTRHCWHCLCCQGSNGTRTAARSSPKEPGRLMVGTHARRVLHRCTSNAGDTPASSAWFKQALCRQRTRRQRRGKGAVTWLLLPPRQVGFCFPITSPKSIFHAFVARSLFPLMVSFS